MPERPWVLMVWTLVALLAAPAARAGGLEGDLRRLLRSEDLGSTQWSIMVKDLTTDKVLATLHADEPMIPASNMKLVTTAAALGVLGPGYTFRTELGLLSPPQAGSTPSLVIRGDGDPAFGDEKLLEEFGHDMSPLELVETWVQAVQQAGVDHVARLIVDDRVFDRQFVHPSWPQDQLINWWCAQVAGVNFHDNVLQILPVRAKRVGLSPRIRITPPSPFLETENLARTTARIDGFWVSRKPETNQLTFHGEVHARPYGESEVTIHDPPLYFARMLGHHLEQAGIRVDRIERVGKHERLGRTRRLHVVQTTLPLILTRTNRDSQNMFAEALFKRMGRKVTGRPGSWTNGAAAVRMFLRRRLGARAAAARIVDGSGMSRDNRLTARLLVLLLESMHDGQGRWSRWRETLSYTGRTQAGQQNGAGTLEGRMDQLERGHWVFGKSGYLNRVSCLSGYLKLSPAHDADAPPHILAFSLMFNGFEPPIYNTKMKNLQDRLVDRVEQAATEDSAVAAR